MNPQTVISFLKSIGATNIVKNGDWLNCSCPLAKYTHQGMNDNKPSFGVVLTTDGTAIYRCFSCTPKAEPLENIISRIHRLSGKYPKKAAKIYANDKQDTKNEISVPVIKEVYSGNFNAEDVKPINRKILSAYFPLLIERDTTRAAMIKKFLNKRGISSEAIEHFGVRYWTKYPGCIGFPFTKSSGKIYAVGIRSIEEKKNFYATGSSFNDPDLKVPGLSRSGAWFGLAQVDKQKPILLCEGAMDAMRLYTLGFPNVLASGGTSITRAQISNIPGLFVIIGLDSDQAGKIAAKELYKKLKNLYVPSVVDWSFVDRKDPGELRTKQELASVLEAKTSKPLHI